MSEDTPSDVPLGPPLHGYQGDRLPDPPPLRPRGLTIALSRESGSRGGSIARRVGKRLGWPVYSQELLEYLANEETARSHLFDDLPADAAAWAATRFEALKQGEQLAADAELGELARLVLMLAARGQLVLVGRGAGYLLPPETTLHVRVVAPLADRVSYIGQMLRLSLQEAAEVVRQRDQRRSEFVGRHFRHEPGDPYWYDLVLNSKRLGEEHCAELVESAARAKAVVLGAEEELPGEVA